MTAKAHKLHRSEEYKEKRETIMVLEENKLRIREVWKKLWKAVWVAARSTVDVLWTPLNCELVLVEEPGRPAKPFDPRQELLKKTMIL